MAFKIDEANNCIDRSNEDGKMLDELQKMADEKAGTPMGDFMSKIAAFTEVGMVVDKTMKGEDKAEVMRQLRDEFESEIKNARANA